MGTQEASNNPNIGLKHWDVDVGIKVDSLFRHQLVDPVKHNARSKY